MEYIGLLLELVFFAMGAYLYLFARGTWKAKDGESQKRMEDFRKDNGWWMRIGGLALMAITLVNLVLHVKDLLN